MILNRWSQSERHKGCSLSFSPFVLHFFSVKFFYFDSGLFQHLLCQLIRITFFKDNFFDTCVDDHFRADDTGMKGGVEGGPLNLYSVVGGLNNSILFCMESPAEFNSLPRGDTHLFAEATNIETMGQPRRGSIVTCRQYLFIFDENSSNMPSHTG